VYLEFQLILEFLKDLADLEFPEYLEYLVLLEDHR
jgi:hypothetical protein